MPISVDPHSYHPQIDPKQATREDDDGRLPIHWAASSNHLDIVVLLAQQRNFDPDVQVRATTRHT